MNIEQVNELKRIKSILSGITGLEDDDQEYIEDAYKGIKQMIEKDQQPSPAQSCHCQNCEAQGKEIQALKSTNDRLLQAITKTVQENLHLADGDNCTLVHLVRALGPDDPGREAPLTREELRAMWIKRETAWDFYINVDARLFGRKDTTIINPPKDTNV